MNAHEYHVEPIDDLHPHLGPGYGTSCPCKPRVVLVDGAQPLVVHNSYDGREHQEPDHSRENCATCTPPTE